MMNVLDRVKQLDGTKVTVQRANRIFVDTDKDRLISVLYGMKLIGFNQLSIMSAIDMIMDNEFEIFYVLYNYKEKVNATVRTRIQRDNPIIETADKIYPPAHTYERELTEMFGIAVNGNSDAGKPFILENWNDMPPMRKDFDSVGYVHKHFVFRYPEDKDE